MREKKYHFSAPACCKGKLLQSANISKSSKILGYVDVFFLLLITHKRDLGLDSNFYGILWGIELRLSS